MRTLTGAGLRLPTFQRGPRQKESNPPRGVELGDLRLVGLSFNRRLRREFTLDRLYRLARCCPLLVGQPLPDLRKDAPIHRAIQHVGRIVSPRRTSSPLLPNLIFGTDTKSLRHKSWQGTNEPGAPALSSRQRG